MTPRDLYDDLVADALRRPEVSVGRMLRSDGLKVHGKVFAFLSGERLVVKVPAVRAADLVAAGEAVPFESGGRPLREWVAVDFTPEFAPELWPVLMGEAAGYVASLVRSP